MSLSDEGRRLQRLFLGAFSVMDVAVALASFDADRSAEEIRNFLRERDYDVVGVRRDGIVVGYVVREELATGSLGDYLHPFTEDDLVGEAASLQEAIRSLGINGRCFVKLLGSVGAIVTLSDLEKPPVRMFLFGMITILEMEMTRAIRASFPDGSWRTLMSSGRLAKAEELWRERRRRNQEVDLLDCLQFSDKGQLMLKLPAFMQEMTKLGISSKKMAIEALKELETLRNNLAHTQEIIPASWERIVIFSSRLERLLQGI